MTIPTAELVYIAALAAYYHAIVFWYANPAGGWQPLLMPVDDETWRLAQH